jgi:hypothetical protein
MQLGGQADPTPIGAKEIIAKAENFRRTALDNGVLLKILLQDYEALDLLPNANQVDLQVQKEVIADCFSQKTRLTQALNSVEFILANASQFVSAESVDLNAFRDQLARAVNAYNNAASNCQNDFRKCLLVSPAPPTPDLTKLPRRRPGVAIFRGTWTNDVKGGLLQALQIFPGDLEHTAVIGTFTDRPDHQISANGVYDTDLQVLDVSLMTKPGVSGGNVLVPPFGHNLQIRLADPTGKKLSVTDRIGNPFPHTDDHTTTSTFSGSA